MTPTMATHSAGIAITSSVPSDLSTDVLEGITDLRLGMKRPKPGFDAVSERRQFQDRLRGLTQIVVATDESGDVRGFAAGRLLKLSPDALMQVRYVYVHPDARYAIRGSDLHRLVLRDLMNRADVDTGYVAGTTSLPGFLTWALSRQVYLWTDPDVGAPAVVAMRLVAADEPTMDLKTGIASSSAGRSEADCHRPRDPRRAALFDRYVAANPNWANGYQLLAAGSVHRADLL